MICAALPLDTVINGSVTGRIEGTIIGNEDDAPPTPSAAAQQSAQRLDLDNIGTTASITGTVARVTGALCLNSGVWPARRHRRAITTINWALVIANAAGTQTAASLAAGDNSSNALCSAALPTMRSSPVPMRTHLSCDRLSCDRRGLKANGDGGVSKSMPVSRTAAGFYRLSPVRLSLEAIARMPPSPWRTLPSRE